MCAFIESITNTLLFFYSGQDAVTTSILALHFREIS